MTDTALRTNGYAAACADCKGWVVAGAGHITKTPLGKWETRHAGECPPTKPRAAAVQPELGYYVRADGAAIKVVESKSTAGRRYGLVFTPHAGKRPSWDYVRGAGISVADLRPMTAADAAGLGLSHGHCVFCCAPLGGTTLSAAVSALIGYGEKCAANESLSFPKGVVAQRAFIAERGK
jgi:hypothetical protein